MSRPFLDIMTISITINCCVLIFNLVPRLRSKVLTIPALRKYKIIVAVCRNYAERPLDLARILTNQLLIWLLILFSLFCICASDVIKQPFHSEIASTWQTILIETLFAVNIGRYAFIITEKLIFKHTSSAVQFRAEVVHHFVTVMSYILFLAYGQNLLLGLVGILVESTSVFDEIGRFCKERERRHTRFYRRLVVIDCVGKICFRGLIPAVFLVMAMFQQSPFTMNYAPLMLFFLSIIFFSVINVWQILSSIQRLIKRIYEKTHEVQLTRETETCHSAGTLGRHRSRRSITLKFAKNNLGYLRPYENKNIANHTDEKDNLNNRKEFAKESVSLHVNPEMLFSPYKLKKVCINQSSARRNQSLQTQAEGTQYSEYSERTPTVLFYSGHRPLRESNSTNDSSQSDTVLITGSNRSSNNSAVPTFSFDSRGRHSTEDLETIRLEPRSNIVRSLSTGNISDYFGNMELEAPV